MATTVDQLRSFGSRLVRVTTDGGGFDGTIVQDRLGDDAVMYLLDTGSAEPIVVGLDATLAVTEVR